MHIFRHISNTPKLKSQIKNSEIKKESMINTPNYDELLYDIETNFTPFNQDSNIRMHYTTMLLLMAE